jgi:hypothetical protein
VRRFDHRWFLDMNRKYRCLCGRTLIVPSRFTGLELHCPHCQAPFRIAEATDALRPEPRPEPRPAIPGPSAHAASIEFPAAELSREDAGPGRPGYEPDLGKRELVIAVGIAVLLTAMLGCVPAIWELKEHFQAVASPGVARWTYGVFFLALLQLAYALYLMQLPDWSSLWVVTSMLLLVAAGYALILGALLARNPEGTFVRMLDLSDDLVGGRAATWCLVMLTVTGLLAVGTGRLATTWRRDVLGA